MKRFRFYAILLAIITFASCSDDFEPLIVTDLETDNLVFTFEGGEKTFIIESNENWSVGEVPEWLTVVVADAPMSTRADGSSYEKGKKSVAITAEKNPEFEQRSAELMMVSVSGKMVKLTVKQDKKSGLYGYWILSEGLSGQGNSELAWFDTSTAKVAEKQFKAKNGKELGDTGNDLAIYGSKMYVVVTGAGYNTETTYENSYIEVINPVDGKSMKRIPFTNTAGVAAKPRNIIFEGAYGYITSYSNELVRLDTATLTLDKHASLSGVWAEGLTFNGGNIYVCNAGRGEESKISVIDIEKMVESKVITTPNNPNKIVSANNGVIYFNTDWPEYKLYKLIIADGKITEMPGLSVADITYSKIDNCIYTSYYDWDNSNGELNQFNIATATAKRFNLELGSPEYHIGTINGSDLLYLTGQMGDNVVVFDPASKEPKHAFKTGTTGGSRLVAVYR